MKSLLFALTILCVFAQPLFAQNTLNNAGLTASTPASLAFSLRKLSSAYAGPVMKVRRSADNAEANVSFDVGGALTASSLVAYTPGITVGSSLGTAQAGTISSDIAKTGTIVIKANRTGTITTSNLSVTVSGTGTSFTTELVVGDRLFNSSNNVFLGVVASITSNTSLVLNNFATVTIAGAGLKTTSATVSGTGTNFTTELAAGDRLFSTANVYLGTVSTIADNTTLTLNAVDAVSVSAVPFKGSSSTITGTGTSFTSLAVGDLLISNNITLGIIASITNASSLTLTSKAGGAVTGLAFKSTAGSIVFSAFYASTSVYVNTWYDQSGNGRDAIQLKAANQARIVNAGTLYVMGGRSSMEFSTSLASFLQTSTAASYLNNGPYTLNKVTAEATNNPLNQFPLSTSGGGGPINSVLHFGYRSAAFLTIAQLSHDHNYGSSASTSLESHTGVKTSALASQLYRNGLSLGTANNGVASYLLNTGLINIGSFNPTGSYYNGSISELIVFPVALNTTDITNLDNNQLLYYSIPTIYWTGAISTNWNTPGNWSTGVVPTVSSPAIAWIPAGKPFYPVINLGTVQANSISVDAGASLTVSGSGVLQLAGVITNFGTCDISTGTIEYNGAAAQTIITGSFTGSVLNLIINNSAGVTLNGNVSVSGNLGLTSGKLSIYLSTLTIGGIITNTVTGALRGEPNSTLIINSALGPTLSFDQTTIGSTNILKNLTINSTGLPVILGNNLIMIAAGTTTFTAGKLAIGSATLTMRGAVVNTVNEGLRGSATANLVADGTVNATLSFDQTTPGTTNVLNNLTLNCIGETITLNRPVAIITAMTLTAGTLADGGNQLVSTGTINIGSGIFKLGSPTVATAWPSFATNNILAGGTVDYASGVSQLVSATPAYQNLTISATGGAIAANDLNVLGILNLAAANPSATLGALSMSTYTLNMGALATTVGQGDMTGIVKRTTILPNITYTMGNEFSSITFPNTGTLPTQISMKIDIGTATSWQPGAIKRFYDFIQTGAIGTKAVINSHYLDTELNGNIENRLVDFSYRFSGPTLTEHGKSNFNTTQNWVGLSNVNVAFFSSTFGNLQLSLDETALTTLTWTGATSTSWITATNWYPVGGPSTNTILIIPDASTTLNDPWLPATASNGSITIEAGGIMNADPGAVLTINNTGLAWSNHGVFNPSTSTIIFANPDATINGTTNFNNVTINIGAGLQLTSGTIMRIGGTITNNGSFRTSLLNNTVEYNGNNQTVIFSQSYRNLIISGTGTTILPATLDILDDLTINGAINTSGNTISMSGSNPQSINGSAPIVLNNLVINPVLNTVSLNQNLTVSSLLTISQGKLAIGNHSLTLSGNVVNTVPNGITGSTASNLIVNGTVSPALNFDQSVPGVSNVLNNFSINSSGQVPLLGSNLEVFGTMLFTAGKLGINGNTLILRGGVTNTVTGGLRGSSSSNLLINGGTISPSLSFDQTIPGTTNLLNTLSLHTTGQSVTQTNPLIVGAALDLTDGLIKTSVANSLTLLAGVSITGGSDLSFVDGPLLRQTNSTGVYTFSIGKLNSYHPVTVTPVSASAGVYSGEYFSTGTPAGANSSYLTGIVTDQYWDISRTTGPDASIELNYTANYTWSAGSPTSMDDIYVSHLSSGTWAPVNGSSIAGNTGTGMTPVSSKVMSSFSPFTFGYGPKLVLPVRLIEFRATRINKDIELVWKIADEVSLASYQVDRSADGRNFNNIGSVRSANSPLARTYSWIDKAPLEGTTYYRLKMVDIDGVFKYSSVIRMTSNSTKRVSVYPNPVTGKTIVLQMYGQQKGMHLINLYNNSGDKLMSNSLQLTGNDETRSITLDKQIPAGLYYLEISDPAQNKTTVKLFIRN